MQTWNAYPRLLNARYTRIIRVTRYLKRWDKLHGLHGSGKCTLKWKRILKVREDKKNEREGQRGEVKEKERWKKLKFLKVENKKEASGMRLNKHVNIYCCGLLCRWVWKIQVEFIHASRDSDVVTINFVTSLRFVLREREVGAPWTVFVMLQNQD